MPQQSDEKTADTWIKLKGDFPAAASPVLAFRLIATPGQGYQKGLDDN